MTDLTIYEKILSGEEPGWIVWEDESYAAILTVDPYNEGHTLVIPKRNAGDDLFDLEDDVYEGLMKAVKKVGQGLKRVFDSERLIVWVRGFEVPHVHVHLIPTHPDVNLESVRRYAERLSSDELEPVYKRIVEGAGF